MSDDLSALHELEAAAGDMLRDLAATGRKDLLRQIAIEVRRGQASRIAKQKNPDGSAYAPRKKKLRARRTLHSIKFLYPSHGNGPPRVVLMKSWQYAGKRLLIGFDVEAGGERTFERQKIIKYLPLEPGEDNARAGGFRKPTVKDRAMFKKIRGPRFMKTRVTPNVLEVGFSGRVGGIAASHQYGLDHHAKRLLLGYSEQEREVILDIVVRHFEKK